MSRNDSEALNGIFRFFRHGTYLYHEATWEHFCDFQDCLSENH